MIVDCDLHINSSVDLCNEPYFLVFYNSHVTLTDRNQPKYVSGDGFSSKITVKKLNLKKLFEGAVQFWHVTFSM